MSAKQRQVGGDHYVANGIQPWDVIDASMTYQEQIGFYRGNVIKYLIRAGRKGSFIEDIQKAQHYMEKLLEVYDREHDEE